MTWQWKARETKIISRGREEFDRAIAPLLGGRAYDPELEKITLVILTDSDVQITIEDR